MMADGVTRELVGLDETDLEGLRDALKAIVAANQARCAEIDAELSAKFNDYEALELQQVHAERQLMLLARRDKR